MKKLICLLTFIPLLLSAQESTEEILAKAIAYHDPFNRWSALKATLHFKETRPSGVDRSTIITMDNTSGYMKINRNDEEIFELTADQVTISKGDGDEARARMLRNYYLYLWGLPMKLTDKDTPEITLAKNKTVNGINCKVLRVAYTIDTWYFSIDESSGRMLQYSFYQDAEETKGELITLEYEIEAYRIKIPQKRSWYTLPDMKYLGTDVLTEVK